jgi:hypothetical protein
MTVETGLAQRIDMDKWLEKLGVSPLLGFNIDNMRYQIACHIFNSNQPMWWEVLMFDNDPTKALLMAHQLGIGEKAALNVPYLEPAEAPVYLGTMCVSMMLWSNACSVANDNDIIKLRKLYHFARDMIYAEIDEVNEDVKPCIEWRIENLPIDDTQQSIAFKILD